MIKCIINISIIFSAIAIMSLSSAQEKKSPLEASFMWLPSDIDSSSLGDVENDSFLVGHQCKIIAE